ncbi:unnamed protein product [Chilo suppressalis]|uniref:FAD-binding PCMH-type domain-containing protein n=1 Tax=Chilo suppressalis TaxID=168631 RepID=A0ABN8LBU8_CHISP|nr:unnamed protein product [Chilo suppressalis]
MDRIKFKVNGEEHSVGSEVSSDLMLVDYLRTRLELHGTKFMCREAGCGACIVNAVIASGETPRAVNSCMVSILSCQDWDITTIEKVGNRGVGYSPVQKTLAEENGTQCGYCSPGWVMAMHGLLQSGKKLSMLEIEKSFGSNICRCTGYRPILKAFKKFAKDAPDSLITDMEDLQICGKTNKVCDHSCGSDDWCFVPNNVTQSNVIKINLKDGKKWYKVTTTSEIFEIFKTEGTDDYMLVAGDTAKGAVPIDKYPSILIDISSVSELKGHEFDQNLIIGANTSLTDVKDIFENDFSKDNFAYLKQLKEHVSKIAHIPVRNLATIAGNLMLKHKHNQFTSDMFLLLETVGAYLTILNAQGSKQVVSMKEFIDLDMKGKILYNILLPPLSDQECKLVTWKVMPRAQSAHAIVNCGLLIKMNKSNGTVLDFRIVFSGLIAPFTRASKTENYLKGKPLFVNDTLQSALKILDQELVATEAPPALSAAYRKQLALALFYKGLLVLCPSEKLNFRYRSGAKDLHDSRPVSTASQSYSTDKNVYPLNKATPKVEALIQTAGEAKYTDDILSVPGEVFGALVLSTVAKGTIESIDAEEALRQPGVIVFFSAKDIPGNNSFMQLGIIVEVGDEEIFCSEKVMYFNQPLGIIVAESTAIAERAAKLVKVQYTDVKKPEIEIKNVRNDTSRTKLFLPLPAIGRGLFVDKVFKNNYTIYSQCHFPMENIKCVARPTEQGLEIYSTTQWIDAVRYTVARALKIDENSVDVYVPRLGGAFGLKISRASLSAIACSLVAYKLNKPCRLIPSLADTTRSVGKRLPCSADVEVGVNKKGEIQYAISKLYEDNGYAVTEIVAVLGIDACVNVYKKLWWDYACYNSTTDTAKNTYCRAPEYVSRLQQVQNNKAFRVLQTIRQRRTYPTH